MDRKLTIPIAIASLGVIAAVGLVAANVSFSSADAATGPTPTMTLEPDTGIRPAVFRDLPNYGWELHENDPRQGTTDFSRDEALARMSTLASAAVTQTLGSERIDPEFKLTLPPVTVDGHPIQLDDMTLAEFRFMPSNTRYTTVAKTSGGFNDPTDAWVAVWIRNGVSVSTWGDGPAAGGVAVVMEDGTGKVHSLTAGKFDPIGE